MTGIFGSIGHKLGEMLPGHGSAHAPAPEKDVKQSSLDLGSDKGGCLVLHPTEGNDTSDVDIVFVHGLMGDRIQTWSTKDAGAVKGTFWPLALLPEKVKNARIITFGYDAQVVSMKHVSHNNIGNHAENLAVALAGLRNETETNERPIIFVGHSLGGLVIQDCLFHSKNGTENYIKKVSESTIAVAFLGTPLRGSGHADWATICGNVMHVIKETNKSIINVLTPDSEVLERIRDTFQAILRDTKKKIKICYFYEELVYNGMAGKIVPYDSATGDDGPRIGIHADHMGMTKFANANDNGFQAVSSVLFKWVDDLRRAKKAIMTEELNICRGFLLLSNPENDMGEIIQSKGERLPGTCEWILDASITEYAAWVKNAESDLLWLYGSPGKGKTIFSIFLVEELTKKVARAPDAILAYYFCDNKNQNRKTASCILRGLLLQLLEQRPEFFTTHIKEDKNYILQKEKMFESFLDLWRIFLLILNDPTTAEIYFVIDGLDECDESSRRYFLEKLNKYFATCSNHSCTRKFIIVSRDLPEINEALCSFKNISLDTCTDKVSIDVNRFIEAEVKALALKKKKLNIDFTKVKEILEGNANCTFLWVSLICKDLADIHRKDLIEKRLKEIPRGLSEIYERILREIPKDLRGGLKNILIWIALAKRPLTVIELSTALQYTSGRSQMDEEAIRNTIDACGSLINIQQETIGLVHQSAKDYLLKQFPATGNDSPLWFHIEIEVAEKQLAETCFNHVQEVISETGVILHDDVYPKNRNQEYISKKLKAHPFLSYTAVFWPEHVRKSAHTVIEIFDLGSEFFHQESKLFKSWLPIFWYWTRKDWCPPTGFTPLHVASFFGITPLAEKLLGADGDESVDLNARDVTGHTALYLAVLKNNEPIVKLLLSQRTKALDSKGHDKELEELLFTVVKVDNSDTVLKLLLQQPGVDINTKDKTGKTPLHHTCTELGNAMKTLLKHKGVDINAKDNSRMTPLHYAAQRGSSAVVGLLLKQDRIEFSAKDNKGKTPLHHAAQGASDAVMKLLLAHKDIGVNAEDTCGKTPLHCAAEKDSDAAVALTRLLLSHKAVNINAKTASQETPLHCAAQRGSCATVELLLEQPTTDPSAKDTNGKTPLHCASQRSSISTVSILELLLSHKPIDINTKDTQGKTPLHCAAHKGSDAAIALLLKQPAIDINAKDNTGKTALHLAARSGPDAVVKLLLEHEGIDVNAEDASGKTALDIAIKSKSGAVALLNDVRARVDVLKCPAPETPSTQSIKTCSVPR